MEGCVSRFTPAEGGARLAAIVGDQNTLAVHYSGFIPIRGLQQHAYKIRGLLSEGSQRSVYVTRASRVKYVAYELTILTDLSVVDALEYEDILDWAAEVETKEVLVCTSAVFKSILENGVLTMKNINFLIIDSCHLIYKDDNLKYIMKVYKSSEDTERPRILALTYPMFTSIKKQTEKAEIKCTQTIGDMKKTINKDKTKQGSIDNDKLDSEEEANSKTVFLESAKEISIDKIEIIKTNMINDTIAEVNIEEQSVMHKKFIIDDEKVKVNHDKTATDDEKAEVNNDVIAVDDEKVEVNEDATAIDEKEDLDNDNKDAIVNATDIGVYENLDDFEMYEKLEWKMEELEEALCCKMDLAEDIDGGKRLQSTTKPKELIIEFNSEPLPEQLSEEYKGLEKFMRDTIGDALKFLEDHRYDPTEIYGDELYEEFMNMPNPTIEPKNILKEFLYILDQLGPYGADKAAFSLLTKLEKLKIKVPYERHFLLYCLCTTVLVKIRCYSDNIFSKYEDDWKKIQAFCTQKVLRFAEILEKFQPPESKKDSSNADDHSKNVDGDGRNLDADGRKLDGDGRNKDWYGRNGMAESKMTNRDRLLREIDKCDFVKLKCQIESRVNSIEAECKEELKEDDQKPVESDEKSVLGQPRTVLGYPRKLGHRGRGRGRIVRSNNWRLQQMQLNPDALCGVVFVKEDLMSKILFLIVADLSRWHPALSYVSAAYCGGDAAGGAGGVGPGGPGAAGGDETVDWRRRGRQHEDVLKKFRMHECNLLLATAALEEGIDLPRCNLVLRWDIPPSYRSYSLSRARARAGRAAAALLAARASRHSTTGLPAEPDLLHQVAVYKELDQIISRKCGCGIQDEPPQSEEDHADTFTHLVEPYAPVTCQKPPSDSLEGKETHENFQTVRNEEALRTMSDLNNIDAFDMCRGESVDTNVKVTVNDVKCDASDKEGDSEMSIEVNKPKDNTELANLIEKLCIETKIDKETNGDVSSPDDRNDNIVCNKCNYEKCSVNMRCQCVVPDRNTNHTAETKTGDVETKNASTEVKSDSADTKSDSADTKSDSVENKSDSVEAKSDNASVDLSNAIALINRYCAKLPSDTFTRLAPQWWIERVQLPAGKDTREAFICTLRLPLNCPLKYNIVGYPMPTRVLARRMAALQACRILHKSGELDNQLTPIGKENFKATEIDNTINCETSDAGDSARPGTTKRRQYYYKRTAWAFTDCQPVIDATEEEIQSVGSEKEEEDKRREEKEKETEKENAKEEIESKKGEKRNTLFALNCRLWCALPERYNTRGRRLHAPQHAPQGIALLLHATPATRLKIPSFPVYTRSGEVRVSLEKVPDADVRLSPTRDRLIRRFMRFVFAEVLRVRRRGMKLQSEGSTHNNYYIVPTLKSTREDGSTKISIDWDFLEEIYRHTEDKKHCDVDKPMLWHRHDDGEDTGLVKKDTQGGEKSGKKMCNPLLKEGEVFVFDPEKYKEAVVTPWYRNQDQPQFFLVAEICWNLSPDSAFPSDTHTSFRHYYSDKYDVNLTQTDQPLLDVDHTSARLNLLTPRYVNRKGVALPVSSERTRRAKRDRLDQKQILVPELCTVHPFAAPLWFAIVALPCVLYRINALLISDEIRRSVALDVGLGVPNIDESAGLQWPPLHFGWSLSEVLNTDAEKEKKKEDEEEESKKEITSQEDLENDKKETDGEEESGEKKEKTVNEILQEKLLPDGGFEIGMWSNDMASSIPQDEDYDEMLEPLPPDLTFCTSASGGTNWCEPVQKEKSQFNRNRTFSMAESDCSYMSSDFDTDDSDVNSVNSDDDTDISGFCSSKNSNAAMGVRIEYKTAHEAEAVDVERCTKTNPAPQPDPQDDERDVLDFITLVRQGTPSEEHIKKYRDSVEKHKKDIETNYLITKTEPVSDRLLPDAIDKSIKIDAKIDANDKNRQIKEIFPYGAETVSLANKDDRINLENIEEHKRLLLNDLKRQLSKEEIKKLNCFSMVDVDIDSPGYKNEKVMNVGFDDKEKYVEKVRKALENAEDFKPYYLDGEAPAEEFDFDFQPDLEGHPGPSPSVILQALTMSNANDGINLERLETIGDSFLKFAITAYLYCAHPTVHEGKLSHMRSKQVSNLNLYRLGRNKKLGARMIASKFEPHDNWLPPCHKPPSTLHSKQMEEKAPISDGPVDNTGVFIPYNLITQHSIPDKSIADCVEALIGAYLLECGPRGALLLMSWLGIKVLPQHLVPIDKDLNIPDVQQQNPPQKSTRKRNHASSSSSSSDTTEPGALEAPGSDDAPGLLEAPSGAEWGWRGRPPGTRAPFTDSNGQRFLPIFGELKAPPSPLLRYIDDPEGELERMLSGYSRLERVLGYRFRDRSLLLQALTHASLQHGPLTDCYQRLEFLGDAILDYLITRHLYEDPRRHSPGALTDLRSALVNNTIFATLAARHGFHKYFRHMSPGLNEVLVKYVKIQEENGHSISEEHYLIQEDELEQAEDVEVPKALGDLFESVAGAIFLDSGMSLGAVWKSYVNLMGAELEAFSAAAPKSPVRELLEAEPDTAKFGKPERLADGRRVRVCVEVFGRGTFKGIGRNYRIAKGTAARCALRHLNKYKPKR